MKKVWKFILIGSFAVYLFALIILLFFGSRSHLSFELTLTQYITNSSNVIPFKTISLYGKALFDGSMNIDIPLKNLFGNVLLFFPMGFYLPLFIKRIRRITTFILSMSGVLFAIETIQILTRRGSFDIDDFILNMFGALIGFVIWKAIVKESKK